MPPRAKKTAGTKTGRPPKAEAITMADLVEMLGLVQRELHLIAAGMHQLIREGKGGESSLIPRLPTLLVGPKCLIKLEDLLRKPDDPIDSVDPLVPWEKPFKIQF